MTAEITTEAHLTPAQKVKSPTLNTRSDSYDHGPPEFDRAIERRLIRKLDQRLVLLAFLCYLAAFLDRSNIGNAQTAGMGEYLGYNDEQYNWLLTIFYIPYILFEWLPMMYKIIPPHIWAFATVLTWGLASMLQAAAFNWSGLMAARFFLAMAEAGFGPGMPLLFSFFYNRRELGFRCGLFVSAAPLATTFAGALAYGITSGHYGIPSWRLLFIIEAIPPLVLAFVVFSMLPDSVATAKFLTEEEKALAKARAIRAAGEDNNGAAEGSRVGHIELREIWQTFKTPQAWVQALMYFSCNVAFASLPVFLPAILTGMGFTSINAQGLTAPPYFLAFLVCLSTTWLADRLQQRGLIIGALSLVGCLGYVLLATCKPVIVRYVGVFLAAAGVFPAIANILSWQLLNQRSDTKRGTGIAIMNIIGQCGPLLGTRVFPARTAPYYVMGMSICAGFMFFNACLTFGLRAYFKIMNDRWDRSAAAETVAQAVPSAGKVDAPSSESKPVDSGDEGFENSDEWRYTL
ncbi:hypothetical protein N0V93_003177 [Gnomoniopsis smithogilvyi]|uniref:Major facilitator superfamily (MFS) profile domain-containing protein n=1 Tax=Gnomoniopsis smithogilvyi TaxID=1191159 RepID=A0A9W8YW59_9PEZI|nr:hypothetical protein N0V93_003177 [Gnomoniopsis smithogilvyi]